MAMLDLTDATIERDVRDSAERARPRKRKARRPTYQSYYCRCDEVGPEQCPEHMDDYVPNR